MENPRLTVLSAARLLVGFAGGYVAVINTISEPPQKIIEIDAPMNGIDENLSRITEILSGFWRAPMWVLSAPKMIVAQV